MRYTTATASTLALLAISLLMTFGLAACGDEPTSSAPMTGTLTLVVTLTDENGNRLTDHSDVTATIDGTTRTATSDKDGFIVFNDLPAGIYVFTLTKPGFSSFKIFGSQFVGGGTAYVRDIFLTEIPTYAIDNLTAAGDTSSSFGPDYVAIAGTISSPSPDAVNRLIRVYLDTSSSVSPQHFINAGTVQVHSGERDFRQLLSLDGLRRAGIAKGARIYVVGYPASLWTLGYFEPTKRKWVEANLAPQGSGVTSFVMP